MSEEIVSLRDLVSYSECEKAYELSKLNLLDIGKKRNMFLRNALQFVKDKLLVVGKRVDSKSLMPQLAAFFNENYSKEWFYCEKEAVECMRIDYRKFLRLVQYLEKRELIVEAKNIRLHIPCMLTVKGKSFHSYESYIDLLLRDTQGKTEAVLFEIGKPQYSMRAKLDENKPYSCKELVGTLVACFHENVAVDKVSMYCMSGNSDKNGQLPEYSITDNIFSIERSMTEDVWLKRLIELLDATECLECDNCRFKTVCTTKYQRQLLIKKDFAGKLECELTPAQEKIVNFGKGQLRCVSVPGSGKTFSLVRRMTKLIQEGDVEPERILFICFANKAAKEIEDRVKESLGTDRIPKVVTFNGLGMQIVLENANLLGFETGPVLATKIETTSLILELIGDKRVGDIKGVSYNNILGNYGLVSSLRNAISKIDAIGKDAYCAEQHRSGRQVDIEGVLRFYDVYKAEYKARGFIGYDEQISLALKVLKSNPEVLKKYATQWDYYMADEYQDASDDNAELLYLLVDASRYQSLCAVGDLDQCIYEFRAANCYKHLYELPVKYPDCQTVIMNDNFRSAGDILRASTNLIRNNRDRIDADMVPHSKFVSTPMYLSDFCVQDFPNIVKRLNQMGYKNGDIAILGRYNKTLAEAARMLEQAGIESISPKTYLRNEAAFLLIYDILNIHMFGLNDRRTDVSFYRIFSVLNRQDGIKKLPVARSLTLYESLVSEKSVERVNLDSIADSLPYHCVDWTGNPLMEVMQRIFNCLYLLKYETYRVDILIKKLFKELTGDCDSSQIVALEKMVRDVGIMTEKDLYRYMALMIDYEDEQKADFILDEKKVNLLTAHESKGMEFKCTIILVSDFECRPDERRLLYVACTRAQEQLILCEKQSKKFEMKQEIEGFVRCIDNKAFFAM